MAGGDRAVERAWTIKEADRYVKVPDWSPAADRTSFPELPGTPTIPPEPPVFESCFRRLSDDGKTVQRYDRMPYVYGGWDTVGQLLARVADSTIAPGGWDRTSGATTSAFYGVAGTRSPDGEKEEPGKVRAKEHLARYHLAGIDCSGFVSRCHRLRGKLSTRELPGRYLDIDHRRLLPGDVLNRPGDHVVLFAGWTGGGYAGLTLYEALGGAPAKPRRATLPRDTHGRVVRRDEEWSWFEARGYRPLSPFPQLVSAGIEEYDGKRALKVVCAASGVPDVTEIRVGGVPQVFTGTPGMDLTTGTAAMTLECRTAPVDEGLLKPGVEVAVRMTNRTAGTVFEDESRVGPAGL
ncbi:hypothetical protein ACIBCM_03885 [Streptomyces sp. NPDC051018]|uniref:hypothetical protein n=1 Tax=Streptomyces sp. NPDC051018 TaxID=3365639 RepID=UPI00379DCE17